MMDDHAGFGGHNPGADDLVEIDLNFESMRRFQAEFSPNLSKGGLFIDTGEPLGPGSVVRFRVILPEQFVFLEGTAVVEWMRSVEDGCDGAPGMALRFVTLSPQNQELIEQLVQDYIDAGGSPFDLDVRPVPADFPTDSLEGAPAPSTESLDEGYRLTVRRTGPSLQAEALRALADAAPDRGRTDLPSAADDEVGAAKADGDETKPEETHEFEILAGPPIKVRPDETTEVDEAGAEPGPVGDPPEFDWSAELTTPVPPAPRPTKDATAPPAAESEPGEAPEEVPVVEPEVPAIPAEEDDDFTEINEHFDVQKTAAGQDVLLTRSLFDDGPEVIDDVSYGDLGGPAFDVSLPEHDDEPDTTPLLPDEGGNDVRVTPEDDFDDSGSGRRRRWPLVMAAVVVLAVGAGFLWPHAQDWLASRDSGASPDPAVVESVETGEAVQVATGAGTPVDSAVDPQPTSDVADAPAEGDDREAVAAETGPPAGAVEAVAREVQPEPTPAMVEPAVADTVTAVDVETGQRGTVIRIRANGSLEDGVVSMEALPSPPRVLIRVRGITNSYRPYVIEAMTAEVTRVRSGLHEERRPSELWIVVDLAEAGVALGGVDIRGNATEIVLARP
jgi:uncharacterized protein (TIGR02266 family)